DEGKFSRQSQAPPILCSSGGAEHLPTEEHCAPPEPERPSVIIGYKHLASVARAQFVVRTFSNRALTSKDHYLNSRRRILAVKDLLCCFLKVFRACIRDFDERLRISVY